MIRATLALVMVGWLLGGCSAALPPGAALNTGGAPALGRLIPDIRGVDVYDLLHRRVVDRFSPSDTRRLRHVLMAAEVMTDTWTEAAPPWTAVLILETPKGRFVVHPVGRCALRLNPSHPFSPRIFNRGGVPITTSELRPMGCNPELFQLLVTYLGPPYAPKPPAR